MKVGFRHLQECLREVSTVSSLIKFAMGHPLLQVLPSHLIGKIFSLQVSHSLCSQQDQVLLFLLSKLTAMATQHQPGLGRHPPSLALATACKELDLESSIFLSLMSTSPFWSCTHNRGKHVFYFIFFLIFFKLCYEGLHFISI